jgi:hypothetical protein
VSLALWFSPLSLPHLSLPVPSHLGLTIHASSARPSGQNISRLSAVVFRSARNPDNPSACLATPRFSSAPSKFVSYTRIKPPFWWPPVLRVSAHAPGSWVGQNYLRVSEHANTSFVSLNTPPNYLRVSAHAHKLLACLCTRPQILGRPEWRARGPHVPTTPALCPTPDVLDFWSTFSQLNWSAFSLALSKTLVLHLCTRLLPRVRLMAPVSRTLRSTSSLLPQQNTTLRV